MTFPTEAKEFFNRIAGKVLQTNAAKISALDLELGIVPENHLDNSTLGQYHIICVDWSTSIHRLKNMCSWDLMARSFLDVVGGFLRSTKDPKIVFFATEERRGSSYFRAVARGMRKENREPISMEPSDYYPRDFEPKELPGLVDHRLWLQVVFIPTLLQHALRLGVLPKRHLYFFRSFSGAKELPQEAIPEALRYENRASKRPRGGSASCPPLASPLQPPADPMQTPEAGAAAPQPPATPPFAPRKPSSPRTEATESPSPMRTPLPSCLAASPDPPKNRKRVLPPTLRRRRTHFFFDLCDDRRYGWDNISLIRPVPEGEAQVLEVCDWFDKHQEERYAFCASTPEGENVAASFAFAVLSDPKLWARIIAAFPSEAERRHLKGITSLKALLVSMDGDVYGLAMLVTERLRLPHTPLSTPWVTVDALRYSRYHEKELGHPELSLLPVHALERVLRQEFGLTLLEAVALMLLGGHDYVQRVAGMLPARYEVDEERCRRDPSLKPFVCARVEPQKEGGQSTEFYFNPPAFLAQVLRCRQRVLPFAPCNCEAGPARAEDEDNWFGAGNSDNTNGHRCVDSGQPANTRGIVSYHAMLDIVAQVEATLNYLLVSVDPNCKGFDPQKKTKGWGYQLRELEVSSSGGEEEEEGEEKEEASKTASSLSLSNLTFETVSRRTRRLWGFAVNLGSTVDHNRNPGFLFSEEDVQVFHSPDEATTLEEFREKRAKEGKKKESKTKTKRSNERWGMGDQQ